MYMEKVDLWKKGKGFLMAKFFGKKYDKSFQEFVMTGKLSIVQLIQKKELEIFKEFIRVVKSTI